jgi:pimeloyl-ACP methyl ester carboxylesterase
MDVRPILDPGAQSPCPPIEGYFSVPPPNLLAGGDNAGRLIESLREAASRRDPLEILVRAVIARLNSSPPGVTSPLSRALADLSVTGRDAYAKFRAAPPTEQAIRRAAAGRVGSAVNSASLTEAAHEVFTRAIQVAWAIRGPVSVRRQLRPQLGWIAVSGEDDPPHRPVNVYSAPYPQHDLLVSCRGIPVVTRFVVCAPHPGAGEPAFDATKLPPEEQPFIPPQCDLIIFLHGHMSRLEEAMSLVSPIHHAAAERGRAYAIISMDLPTNGYATYIDHEQIGPALKSRNVPVLDFVEDFVQEFVAELVRTTGTQARVAAVIGGSLGGNLTLRLAEKQPAVPWAQRFVAWSPASIWNSQIRTPPYYDPILDFALSGAVARSLEHETPERRTEYFKRAFDESLVVTPAQAEQWYAPSWPCRTALINAARLDRRETYHPLFRKWHWRLGYEQLIFSHVENGADGRPLYERIRGPLLLCAGREDNFAYTNIWDAAGKLARAMTNTVGHTLFLDKTGHSMHAERPELMAKEIADFLAQDPWRSAVKIETPDRRRLGVRAGVVNLGETGESFAVTYHRLSSQSALSLRGSSGLLTVGGDAKLRAAAQPEPGAERFTAMRLGVGGLALRGSRFPFLEVQGNEVHGSMGDPAFATPFRFLRSDEVPPDLPGQPLTDSPGVCRRGTGELDVFVRGPANEVLHRTRRGTVWSAWTSLNFVATSELSAVSWGGARLDVFARGIDGGLNHAWRDNDNVPWQWENLRGILASGPAAVASEDQHIDIFVRGTDGAVWHLEFHRGWKGWVSRGERIDGTLAAASWGSDHVDVYARIGQRLAWRRRRGGRWEESWRFDDTLRLESSPSAFARSVGLVTVAARSFDRVTYSTDISGDSPGSLPPRTWRRLGGVAMSAPALVPRPGGIDAVVVGTDRGLFLTDALVAGDAWTPFAR